MLSVSFCGFTTLQQLSRNDKMKSFLFVYVEDIVMMNEKTMYNVTKNKNSYPLEDKRNKLNSQKLSIIRTLPNTKTKWGKKVASSIFFL